MSSLVPDDEMDDEEGEEEEEEEEEQATREGNELTDNAEGTLAWEQATETKGPKKKKKKSEGTFVSTSARCRTGHFIMASDVDICASLKVLHWRIIIPPAQHLFAANAA